MVRRNERCVTLCRAYDFTLIAQESDSGRRETFHCQCKISVIISVSEDFDHHQL